MFVVVLATVALLVIAAEVLVLILVVSIGVTLLDLLLAFDVFAAF